MIKKIILLFLIAILTRNDCQQHYPNNLNLIDDRPQLLQEVPNGQKYIIGNIHDEKRNFVYVAKVKGTPLEMGKALGQLFKNELKDQLSIFYKYYIGQLVHYLIKHYVPKFLSNAIGNESQFLLKRLLDLNVMITKKYTNKRYLDEIKGIAKGAGVNGKELQRINIFPQLIKAACTAAGVWGKAVGTGDTLHLRSLDWDPKIPISKYPLIAVYHPTDPKLNIHATVGWVGLVGTLTGVSPYLSVGEKVWDPRSGSVKTTRYGNPWTYVLRDVLYDTKDLKSAIALLYNTHRTCTIHLGIASAADHSFRMFQYAQQTLNNYDDKNYTHYNDAHHPKKSGIAYFDKFVQPSENDCVGSILANPKYYGNWAMEPLWRMVGKMHNTGDTQLAVFNLETQQGLLSYSQYNGTTLAYDRRPIYVNYGYFYTPF